MTKYCPKCDGDQPAILVQEEETFPVKGSPVTIMSTICRCATCGTDILDMEIDDNNLRKAYAKFREQNSLLQPEEIKAIRMQYGLSAKSFSKVLGLGEISITRYENGSLQDEAQNNLILLVKEADNFSVLFEKNQAKLSESEVGRIRKLLGKARTITVWEQVTSVHSSFPQQM